MVTSLCCSHEVRLAVSLGGLPCRGGCGEHHWLLGWRRGGRVVGAGVLQSHGCNAGTRDTCIQIKSNKYTLYIPLLYITNNRERESNHEETRTVDQHCFRRILHSLPYMWGDEHPFASCSPGYQGLIQGRHVEGTLNIS